MKLFRTLILAFVVSLASVGVAMAQAAGDAPVSGQDIIKTVSQSRGKVVVINFWASWCGPCRQEIPELIELRKRFPEDKLVILGVSVDQEHSMYAMYKSRAGFNYPVMRAKPDVSQAFSIRAIPRTVVYSPKGEVVHSQEGYMAGDDLEKMIKKLIGA
ncbi:MAG: TlpA family protein disulfide reductase [Acidobacteriota bacterium]